jgi:hypothetical protein
MAQIVVLMMEGAGHASELQSLRDAGHEPVCIEPRWPECRATLSATRPALVIVDGSHQPSHGRAAAGWLSSQAHFRTVPFLFLDVPDRDMVRVKKEVQRAQFGTWSSVIGASDRLAKKRG